MYVCMYVCMYVREREATLTQELDLSINGISLKRVNSSKCLFVEIDEFLTLDAHISSVSEKVSSGIGVIKKIKPFVPTSNLISVYQSIVEPYLVYCSVVWHDISLGSLDTGSYNRFLSKEFCL